MIITNEQQLRSIGPCVDVLPEEINNIRDLLETELKNSRTKGVGLAAPQIGIAKNFAIVRIDDHCKVDLVNCKIEKGYDKRRFRGEGCLSFPNRFEDTDRWNEILVAGNLVSPLSFICTGLMAVVTAHELNHLENILLPDLAIQKGKKRK